MYTPPVTYSPLDAATLGKLDSKTLYDLATWFDAQAASIRSWALSAQNRERSSLIRKNRLPDRLSLLRTIGRQLHQGAKLDDVCNAYGVSVDEAEVGLRLYRRRVKQLHSTRPRALPK
jgi:hypothetical protein